MRALGVLVALVMVAAACGDDGNGVGVGVDNDEREPVAGGSITMGMFSQVRALDPIAASGDSTAGGTELTAIYDTVMQYDEEAGEYEPRTAESLEHNQNHTEWTLTLRPGIAFRDGTPYDAEAVRLSFERHAGPQNTVNPSRSHLTIMESVEVIDPLTVRFVLQAPWPGFPYLLADGPGMLVSPTALAALGDPGDPGYADRKAAFNLNPVGAGAGPFEVASFLPGEALTLRKNPNYWGGEVYLDELRFVVPAGAPAAYEALRAGNLQVAFLRSPEVADRAKRDGYPHLETIKQAGDLLLINNGAAGPAAGENITVRRAIAAAIDPQVVNERTYQGTAPAGNALFNEDFRWHTGVEGPEVDNAEARRLVEQAREEGWDGRLRFLCTNQPERVSLALAVQTMLQAAGITVELNNNLDVAAHISEVIGKKDFDISCWGMAISNDPGAALALRQNWYSTSPTNRVGYESSAMDLAIDRAQRAGDDEEAREAYSSIAEVYRQEIPSLVMGAMTELTAWDDSVRGIYANQRGMLYFDQAWIDR